LEYVLKYVHNTYNEKTGKWAEDMSQLMGRLVKIK